jgi:hypothetical protein
VYRIRLYEKVFFNRLDPILRFQLQTRGVTIIQKCLCWIRQRVRGIKIGEEPK